MPTTTKKKVSRQRSWQLKKIAEGKCPCGKEKAPDASVCPECGEIRRTQARNRYRVKKGIPLNAPIAKRKKRKI